MNRTGTQDTPTAKAHRWFARIGASAWFLVLLGVMLAKDRFEPLLLVALGLPFVALLVSFERLADSSRWRPLAAGALFAGVGLLLMWVDGLLDLRPEWADLLMPAGLGTPPPSTRWSTFGMGFVVAGIVTASVSVVAARRRARASRDPSPHSP
ncbi:MAG: hypothetical protein JNL94_06880 [Planctomycetes bacterium]|nr:hypothetical protein [Planctomycetota bacterium]